MLLVTLVIAIGFLPQNFGMWQGPTNGTLSFCESRFNRGGYHEGVETLKLYLMQKNLFELTALTGRGTHTLSRTRIHY